MDKRFMVMTRNCPQRVVCPWPGAIHMYMTIIFKHTLKQLGQSKPNIKWSIVRKGV